MAGAAIYDLTFLPTQRQTIPSVEYSGLTAATVIDRVAPEDGPRILTEKAQAPHFVTCLLAVAPYISKTAERFEAGAQGKQRSSQHVTDSAWFAFDCDDISPEDKDAILDVLDGTVYCVFSTHGHGQDAGKVRMRVLLFMDRALCPTEWAAAWGVINTQIFDSKADTATAKVYQAAGVWTAHPDRLSQSFRYVGRGEPLCANKLLELAPKPTARRQQFKPRPSTSGAQRARYAAALHWLDAGDYATWNGALMSLRAAMEVGDMTDAEAREAWITWSATAPTARQARNGQSQYSPETMFDRKPKLTTSAPILVAALFKRARDEAERIVRAELRGNLSPRAVDAAKYLRRFHPSTLDKLRSAA